MKASELRIGNLVLTDKQDNTVSLSIIAQQHCAVDYSHTNKEKIKCCDAIRPIPIAAERLERLGFERSEGRYMVRVASGIGFYYDLERKIFYLNFQNHYGDIPIYHIKYIHQVQNLFHDLTGEELTEIEKQ